MGQSNTRLPYPVNRTILDMVNDQLLEHRIPLDQISESDFRHFRRKVQRRVMRYMQATFTPNQLDTMNYSSDGLSEISTNQWQTLHAIVRDCVVTYVRRRSNTESGRYVRYYGNNNNTRSTTGTNNQRLNHTLTVTEEDENVQDDRRSRVTAQNQKKGKLKPRLSTVACSMTVGPAQIDKLSECPICLKEFELNDVMLTLMCFHVYHQSCFVPWFKQGHDCPICRIDLTNAVKQSEVSNKSHMMTAEDTDVPQTQPPNEQSENETAILEH